MVYFFTKNLLIELKLSVELYGASNKILWANCNKFFFSCIVVRKNCSETV